MRKGRGNLFNWFFGGLLLINAILVFTVLKGEFSALRGSKTLWSLFVDHPLLMVYQTVFVGLLVAAMMLMMYESGRKKGIEEMADELHVNPKDYYNHKGDKIMVTEKRSIKGKRNTYAIPDKETTD